MLKSKIFLTADTHFSHAKIIEYEPHTRRFDSVDAMNESLCENWNSVVSAGDTVYMLGDVALGHLATSLPENISRLNGTKILISGNHDRNFVTRERARKAELGSSVRAKQYRLLKKWHEFYLDNGFTAVYYDAIVQDFGYGRWLLSHFPYVGDSYASKDRYQHCRPSDNGVPLVHGHVHSQWQTALTSNGTPMVNVGVDARALYPVPVEVVANEFEELKR